MEETMINQEFQRKIQHGLNPSSVHTIEIRKFFHHDTAYIQVRGTIESRIYDLFYGSTPCEYDDRFLTYDFLQNQAIIDLKNYGVNCNNATESEVRFVIFISSPIARDNIPNLIWKLNEAKKSREIDNPVDYICSRLDTSKDTDIDVTTLHCLPFENDDDRFTSEDGHDYFCWYDNDSFHYGRKTTPDQYFNFINSEYGKKTS